MKTKSSARSNTGQYLLLILVGVTILWLARAFELTTRQIGALAFVCYFVIGLWIAFSWYRQQKKLVRSDATTEVKRSTKPLSRSQYVLLILVSVAIAPVALAFHLTFTHASLLAFLSCLAVSLWYSFSWYREHRQLKGSERVEEALMDVALVLAAVLGLFFFLRRFL